MTQHTLPQCVSFMSGFLSVCHQGQARHGMHEHAHTHSLEKEGTPESRPEPFHLYQVQEQAGVFMVTDVRLMINPGKRYQGTFQSEGNVLYPELGGVSTLKFTNLST